MASPSTELKPCPFCGAPAERVDNGPTKEQVQHMISWGDDVDDGGSFIRCTRCDASTAIHYDRKENLVSSWNERVMPASVQTIAETLEFYANPEIYKPHPHGPAFDDRDVSFKAKNLLAKLKGDENV